MQQECHGWLMSVRRNVEEAGRMDGHSHLIFEYISITIIVWAIVAKYITIRRIIR